MKALLVAQDGTKREVELMSDGTVCMGSYRAPRAFLEALGFNIDRSAVPLVFEGIWGELGREDLSQAFQDGDRVRVTVELLATAEELRANRG